MSYGASAVGVAVVRGFELRTRLGPTGAWSATATTVATAFTFTDRTAAGTYRVDVRALDSAGNVSGWREITVMVPTDDARLVFSSGSSRIRGSAYYAGALLTTARTGAKITLRFTGSSFCLLGRTSYASGQLRITIDGVSYTVDEGYYAGRRSTATHYRVLLFNRALALRAHTVVITALGTRGRPTVAVDGVGWRN